MNNKYKAFTLIEVIIVIICISVIAAFMIPNYAKTFYRSDERNMIANMVIIRTALNMYLDAGGVLGNWNSLDTINTNLDLNVIDPKATYGCRPGSCWARHPQGWDIRFNVPNGPLYCNDGPCPSCVANCG